MPRPTSYLPAQPGNVDHGKVDAIYQNPTAFGDIEPLYELDTEKVTQEVEADVAGVLLKIAVEKGEVPVGQTVALAYRFLFSEIGTILGICWFPALLSSLASYLTAIYAAMHAEQIQAHELGPEIAYAFVSVMGIAITVFAASVMAVALTRHVLGRRATGVVAYFAVGPVEWRMFGAIIRYIAGSMALVVAAIMISALAFNVAGVPVDSAAPVRATAPNVIAVLIAWAAFIAAFAALSISAAPPRATVAITELSTGDSVSKVSPLPKSGQKPRMTKKQTKTVRNINSPAIKPRRC